MQAAIVGTETVDEGRIDRESDRLSRASLRIFRASCGQQGLVFQLGMDQRFISQMLHRANDGA